MHTHNLRVIIACAALAALSAVHPGASFAEKKTIQPPSGAEGLPEDSAAGAVVKSALGGKTTMSKDRPVAIAGQQLNDGALKASDAQTKASRQSQNIEQTMQAAFMKLDRGDCQGALADSASVISMDAKMAAAHIAHGDANYCLKNYTEAAKDATAALAIEPENDNALALRSRTYKQMQDYKRAYDDLAAIRSRQTADARLWNDTAKLAEAAGNMTAAQEEYKTAATLDPARYEPVLREFQERLAKKAPAAGTAKPFRQVEEEGVPSWLLMTGAACAGILLLLLLMVVMKKAMS